MTATAHDASLCPIYHHAIELIGRRWSGAILQVMRGRVARFSDIAAAIPGLSDRMLSERLKELEAEGLIERRVYAETPVRVEYRLTSAGQALGAVLDHVREWAHNWLRDRNTPRPRDGGAPSHGVSANGTASHSAPVLGPREVAPL